MVALDARTGQLKWHYQFTPNDAYDYDACWELILADKTIDGKKRKVVMQMNRNGFLYVIDRTNGKLIAANAFVKQNWAERIDMVTGRPVLSDVAKRLIAGEKVELWPRTTGGKNWPPMAFNPRTGLLYFTRLDEGMMLWYNPKLLDYRPGQRYTGAVTRRFHKTLGLACGTLRKRAPR